VLTHEEGDYYMDSAEKLAAALPAIRDAPTPNAGG
jgi:hypothetical protein